MEGTTTHTCTKNETWKDGRRNDERKKRTNSTRTSTNQHQTHTLDDTHPTHRRFHGNMDETTRTNILSTQRTTTNGPGLEETRSNKGRRGHPKNETRVQTSTSSSPRRRPGIGSCTGRECDKKNPNLLGNEERRQETRACNARTNEG